MNKALLLLALAPLSAPAANQIFTCYAQDRFYHYEGEAPTKQASTDLALRACYTQSPTPDFCKFEKCDAPRTPDPRTVMRYQLAEGRRVLVCTPALLRAGICTVGKITRKQ